MKPKSVAAIFPLLLFFISLAVSAQVFAYQSSEAKSSAAEATSPLVDETLVFEERDGLLAVEAEHFFRQSKVDQRNWQLTTSHHTTSSEPDGDPPHVVGASGGEYIEILPDSRRTHADKLINNVNFCNVPGEMAVVDYQVKINQPGRYYVWVRAYSTGSEDNGVHVGLDGQWPESGRRMQWCEGKNTWHWESKQRTEQEHCGVPHQIFLDIEKAGTHTISFSMREDGFEFDKWLITTDRDLARPEALGPETRVVAGNLPEAFAFVAVEPVAEFASLEPHAETAPVHGKRSADGNGAIEVSGELKTWHKITLTLNGPFAHELDNDPNPFTDCRFQVEFSHAASQTSFIVPGYFAADGDAANSSAKSGTQWRAHFAPDKPGEWKYRVTLQQGRDAALDAGAKAESLENSHGKTGDFQVAASDKTGRDFRSQGRLEYVGGHHLKFAGSGRYFLKAGPDAPETLLAYEDFDDTIAPKAKVPLKSWKPHQRDWRKGDPSWKDGKGTELIGAVNYVASKGCNSISFLPYNAGGDGDNVWPFVGRDDKLHYDCSKLDQWQIVFDHACQQGVFLHFKLQENEMDDNLLGQRKGGQTANVKTSLDGGDLGRERKLYIRELVARFSHELALNWNLGEENTQTTAQQTAMAKYITAVDPYNHLVVVHTFPGEQDQVYTALLGKESGMTGASLQNHWNVAHQRTLKWVQASDKAGSPWVVCNDEQGPAGLGVPPDPGYEGFAGQAGEGQEKKYDLHDIRHATLWGTIMAGGAGVEYYFGYALPQNDLICEDFRSRDQSWDYCRIALDFFHEHNIPFWEMQNADGLVGNDQQDNSRYCFTKPQQLYLIYLSKPQACKLDLREATGKYSVSWFDPKSGGDLQQGSVAQITAGDWVDIGKPPAAADQDFLAVIRKQ